MPRRTNRPRPTAAALEPGGRAGNVASAFARLGGRVRFAGALTADESAQTAEFFSFGPNDPTQTCLGMSRDDSGSFLGAWLWSISPQANFVGAAVCGALGTLWFWGFIYRKRGR